MTRPAPTFFGLLLLVSACTSSRPLFVQHGPRETLRPLDAAAPHATGDPLVVETTAGAVRGKRVGEVRAFFGIPFAEPPIGPLRFHSPAPKSAWEGVRDATNYGSACAQTQPNGRPMGSEDCLFLNVWAPSDIKPGEPRPVMFFIHGGALVLGASNQTVFYHGAGNVYDGRTLAESQGVIVVSTNYRLGKRLLGLAAE